MATLQGDQSQLQEQRLLIYATPDGAEVETVWNSRIGFVPKEIKSAQSGAFMQLIEAGELDPRYVPDVGSRVITDMTEQRARVVAAQCLQEALDVLELRKDLESLFPSREEALKVFFDAASACSYDVLTVTSGFIQDIEEYRAGGTPVMVSSGMIDPDPGPSESTAREHYFDRQGRPITIEQWMAFSENRGYKVLDRTVINDDLHVSTIWLGIDHSFMGSQKPVIFETMVFRRLPEPHVSSLTGPAHEFDEDGCWRYCTEAEAFAGHKRTVELMIEKEAKRARGSN